MRSLAKCVCNQDDILVGVFDSRENLQIEGDVLERLQKYNVCLNLRKCVFLKKQVDGDGFYPVQEKIDAIKHQKMWASLGHFWVWYSIIHAFYQY